MPSKIFITAAALALCAGLSGCIVPIPGYFPNFKSDQSGAEPASGASAASAASPASAAAAASQPAGMSSSNRGSMAPAPSSE